MNNEEILDNEEKIDIYKPTLIKENPLKIDQSVISYNDNLTNNSVNGFIPVKLETDIVIQRISKDLYANSESGIRELYNNEARACRSAIKNHNAKPLIEVTLNANERKLIIHGLDSMGMSSKRFLEIFTVLGRSDNFDSSEIGQFGFGRASYLTLGDLAIFEIWSRETNEKYAFMGKNGIGFNILPKENVSLDTFGMKITITLYENTDYRKLLLMLTKLAMFSKIKTILINESEIDKSYHTSYFPLSDDHFTIGRYELNQSTYKEYLEKIMKYKTNNELKDYDKIFDIEIDNDDIYFYGYILMHNKEYKYNRILGEKINESYLLGSPIENDMSIRGLTAYILNVKDERKYQPSPDRERLNDKSCNVLENDITENIKSLISEKYKLRSLDDFLASNHKKFFTSYDNTEYFDDETRFIINALKTDCITELGRKNSLHTLEELLNDYGIDRMIQVDRPDKKTRELIDLNFQPYKKPFNLNQEIARSLGFLIWEDYILSHEIITPIKEDNIHKPDEILLWKSKQSRSSNWIYEYIITKDKIWANTDQLPSNTIMTNNIKALYPLFQQTLSDFHITKYNKYMADIIPDLSKFCENLHNEKINTTKGLLTFKQVAKQKDTLKLLVVPDNFLINAIKKHTDHFVIVGSDNEIVKLGMYLTNYKNDYDIYDNIKSIGCFNDENLERYSYRHERPTARLSDSQLALIGITHITNEYPTLRELAIDDIHLTKNALDRYNKLKDFMKEFKIGNL